ncbi:hypothetical protein N9S49_00265 [Rhodobiaceae bacterium]|jgi:hypothetical protein|nr:hypothetical protein [Rhodobiaceae bacterium]
MEGYRIYFSGFFTYKFYAADINSFMEQRAGRIEYLKANVPSAGSP